MIYWIRLQYPNIQKLMSHQKYYYELRDHYSFSRWENPFSESGFSIYNVPFTSPNDDMLPYEEGNPGRKIDGYQLDSDDRIEENRRFVYPVFIGHQPVNNGKVTILLHGLNERDWDKYLPWARALHKQTGQPVILFPISFHVNRCPESWKDPRLMTHLARERKKRYDGLSDSTFLNAAISERIQMLPKRFYTSGLQTYYDLVALIAQIKSGNHPLLGRKTQVNFFGYSIGALLTEILLMVNPKNLLNESKAFLFCGGSSIDRMKGVSRFILDSEAFHALRAYFVHLDEYLGSDNQLKEFLKKLDPGVYFRSMIDSLGLRDYRISRMKALSSQLKILTLKKDRVISPQAVRETFEGMGSQINRLITVMDFPYSYSHENVFPLNGKMPHREVDNAFDRVFTGAAQHLV